MNWDFLLNLLAALVFPSKFPTWIKECITTPRFSININGELARFFGSTRGLHQGDPLSSYLFVIILEGLSMLIHQKVEDFAHQGYPFEYHRRCSSSRITHLCFADDLILFYSDSIQSSSLLSQRKVHYQWKPQRCSTCKVFGHSDTTCPSRVIPTFSIDGATEKNHPSSSAGGPSQTQTWQRAGKRRRSRVSTQSSSAHSEIDLLDFPYGKPSSGEIHIVETSHIPPVLEVQALTGLERSLPSIQETDTSYPNSEELLSAAPKLALQDKDENLASSVISTSPSQSGKKSQT